MRTILLYAMAAVLLTSCGSKKEQNVEAILETNDLAQLRAKKTELDQKRLAIVEDLSKINTKIATLDTNEKVSLITILEIKEQPFIHYLELQGNVQTKKNVLVYPETAGQILNIYVKEGDQVKKGQALARLDDGGMSNQLAQLEANLSLAKTTYERQERLWSQKIGSEIQFLQTKTNYESQKNAVSNLKKMIGKYTIRAPFTGVIDDVIKEQGTVIAPGPGSELFRIVNLGDMYIETEVSENYITAIKEGKSVEVSFPILDTVINSTVRQAGNFINPANRTFKVEIGVPNKNREIKPNLTAKLKINDYTNTKAILIPQSIISENAEGEQYVYVVNDIKNNEGKAKQVIIKTGKTQGDIIEVLEGVSEGDKLIEAGARSVKDGQKVKISKS